MGHSKVESPKEVKNRKETAEKCRRANAKEGVWEKKTGGRQGIDLVLYGCKTSVGVVGGKVKQNEGEQNVTKFMRTFHRSS
jgi:hypothetical protein